MVETGGWPYTKDREGMREPIEADERERERRGIEWIDAMGLKTFNVPKDRLHDNVQDEARKWHKREKEKRGRKEERKKEMLGSGPRKRKREKRGKEK